VKRRLRPLDWLLIVALMASWSVIFARVLQEGLRTGQARTRISLHSAAGAGSYPTVRTNPVPSWNAGLEPDDEILSIAGEDMVGRTALYFFEQANRAGLREGSVPLRVRRSGLLLDVPVPWGPTPGWWLTLAGATASVLVSLMLYVAVPGWHIARRYFLSVWCFASTTSLIPSLVTPLTLGDGLFICAVLPLGGFLMVLAAQEFTISARPVPWTHRALAASSFLVLFLLFTSMSVWSWRGALEVSLRTLAFPFFVGAAVAGLVHSYMRSQPLERRQIRWVVFGGFIAAIAQFFNVLAFSGDISFAWVAPLIVVTQLAVPVGVLVSVVGYGWLDVDRLISATASYAIVGLLVLGGALALIPRVAHAAAPMLGFDASTGQWALTLALMGAAIPLHQFLRPRIDRRLFAERHQRMLGFERLLSDLGHVTCVEELTRVCGERLEAILAPESIAVYARQEAAFTPLFVRGRAAPPAFGTDSPLLQTLARRARPLSARSAELDAFDRAALETLGTAVVVPTRQGETIVAITCLGAKRSGDIYTPEELAHLTAVASRCAEVLLRLGDEVVIREAREMQQALRRYVPGVVAEELDGGRTLEAAEREVSVFFVDIRGYSSFAERRAAEEVFSALNAYTETVSRVVREHGGAIVEFHGDGLMAVFGAPRALDRKERAAVLAARDVIEALGGSLEVGIGIATGPAFVGNIRAADRLIWSAVGNTTNLAARLQTVARELGAVIAIDAPTRKSAGPVCADFECHPDIAIRGQVELREVWALQRAAT
jgi:class 3 adenylate cyclase